MMSRIRTAIVLGILLGLSSEAAAEDQEKHFTWHPSMLVTLVGDDQPYLHEQNDGAIGTWISPQLDLGYRGDFYELSAELGGDVRRYVDEPSLSREFYRMRATAEAGILPGLSVFVSEALVPGAERIAAPGDATRNLIQTNQVDVEVRYWRELPSRRELQMTFRGSHFAGDHFNTVLLTDGGGLVTDTNFDPDHWEGAADIELQTPFGERSSLYLRSDLRYRSFSESAVTDHGEVTVMAGFRTRRFQNIEIDVAAGWGMISFESRDNVRRFVGEGSLRYRLPNGWTWRLSSANRFVSDYSGNNFVETTGRMGVEKYFGDLISVSAAGFVSGLENDAWDTEHNFFAGAEFRLRGRIARHTELSVTYRYWRNAGDLSYDDFEQNRVAIEFYYRR
jgi:hypothetical protein